MNQLWATFRGLFVALLATASVCALRRTVFTEFLGLDAAPLMPFMLAVIAAAWLSGLKSGLIATVLSSVAGTYLFVESTGRWIIPPFFQGRLVLFVLLGGLVSYTVESLRFAWQRLEDRQRELEQEVRRREQAETALREREERVRLAVESAEIGTWDFSPLTGRRNWSERAKAMFGLPPEADVTNLSFREFVHPDDRKPASRAIYKALDPSGDGTYEIDYRVLWPDGSIRWIVAKGQVLFDGVEPERRATRFIGTVLDITERKQAEEALRQALEAVEAKQELLRHTIEFQDQERQLIAYEIHDGLVQYAAGALMQLEAIQDQLNSKEVADQIEEAVGILRRTVAEGRRLINGIRTPVLDDWGVEAAMEQLIEEEDRAHVQIQFIKDDGLGRMAPRIEETLYRITQEALTNIRKHSQSKRVCIELGRREDHVHLEVRDWGVGFAPSNGSARGHGLKGMAQRASISGGECVIDSAPGNGTKVIVDLPYIARN
jgi:PAS domain S-box-containing protein